MRNPGRYSPFARRLLGIHIAGRSHDAVIGQRNARPIHFQNEAEIERLSSENDQLRADLEEIRRLLNVRDRLLQLLLALVVDFSARGHVLDYADWLNARLI